MGRMKNGNRAFTYEALQRAADRNPLGILRLACYLKLNIKFQSAHEAAANIWLERVS